MQGISVGDIVYTSHECYYMISQMKFSEDDKVYLATTIDPNNGYTGTICYFKSEECRTIDELVKQIHCNEGLVKIIHKEDFIKIIDNLK